MKEILLFNETLCCIISFSIFCIAYNTLRDSKLYFQKFVSYETLVKVLNYTFYLHFSFRVTNLTRFTVHGHLKNCQGLDYQSLIICCCINRIGLIPSLSLPSSPVIVKLLRVLSFNLSLSENLEFQGFYITEEYFSIAAGSACLQAQR